MDKQEFTFQDIIRLNDNDWDRAYEVLNFHLENGTLEKEVIQGEQVIYHNTSGMGEDKLIHVQVIQPKPILAESTIRPKRKRINQG